MQLSILLVNTDFQVIASGRQNGTTISISVRWLPMLTLGSNGMFSGGPLGRANSEYPSRCAEGCEGARSLAGPCCTVARKLAAQPVLCWLTPEFSTECHGESGSADSPAPPGLANASCAQLDNGHNDDESI